MQATDTDKVPIKQLTPKLFCLGLNKTGTTSFGTACKWLGMRRLGWRPLLSKRLITAYFNGGVDFLLDTAEDYDAFEDIPWPLAYKELHEKFPNAKFVLTVRKSKEVWYNSIKRHVSNDYDGHKQIYGYYRPTENPTAYMDVYTKHNESVQDYFEDKPNKLLVMCFEDGDGWGKLLPFLGLKGEPIAKWPHKNIGRKKQNEKLHGQEG